MPKRSSKQEETAQPMDMAVCRELVREIALTVNNGVHDYWFSRADATQAMKECHEQFFHVMKDCDELAFRIVDGKVTVNGNPIADPDATMQAFIAHLGVLEIDNFALHKDITKEDFLELLEIFEAHPVELQQLGGFMKFVADAGLEKVIVKEMVLTELGDHDVIVDESEVKGEGACGSGEEQVGSILAFLKGELPTDDARAVRAVNSAATDPGQMADLILQAADIREAPESLESSETLVDFVVGCLRRTYDGMMQDKQARTKIGRKRITKNLLLLEEEVLKRMREMASEWDEADFEAITDTVQEMTDEIKVDTLVDDYAAKRRSMEKSEQQLLDYLKTHGMESVDDVRAQDKMRDHGLGSEEWQQLVVKSGSPGGAAGSGGSDMGGGGGEGSGGGAPAMPMGQLFDAISHLDVLLDSMDRQFDTVDKKGRQKNQAELFRALSTMNREIGELAGKTHTTIAGLMEHVAEDADIIELAEQKARAAGVALKLTRRELLDAVSGIVHEIGQPLALIGTSLDMIVSKTFGGLGGSQGKMLELARENVRKLQGVFTRLESLGVPIAEGSGPEA